MEKLLNVPELGEKEYSYLFDIIPCHISIQNRELRIIKTNSLTNKDFGQCVGEHCYRIYAKREEACPDCCVLKTFSDGLMHKCEKTVINDRGDPIDVVISTAPIKNKKGEIVAVMEMFSDISEMKALQKELELSWQEYKYLFDRVPCYISVQDRDFRIIESNALFKQDFGHRLGEYCYSVYKGRNSICEG